MAVDLAAVVGSENMTASGKEAVINTLRNLDQPDTVKRYLYARWTRIVGLPTERADIDRIAPWGQR